MSDAPTLAEIESCQEQLARYLVKTPVVRWRADVVDEGLSADTELFLKLELFQVTGTFKPRGALAVVLDLSPEARAPGLTCVSAGNHAMATAWVARATGTTAKVVMPKNANPFRVGRCRELGAEVVLVDDVHAAFAEVERIEREEGRHFVHPFDGPLTCRGTATVGLEIAQQLEGLDAIVVPIGGGGLCAGVARAMKLLQPSCTVYGVEPEGADSMHRSFAAGEPRSIDKVRTIADSLGAPHAEPYSFAVCRDHVDELVLVDDEALKRTMRALQRDARLLVEPAGAASTAAALGPLADKLRGKRALAVVCGSNIDLSTFSALVAGSDGEVAGAGGAST